MAWAQEMVEIVRVLTDDMGTTERNSDEALRRVLVVAAFQVAREMTFSQTFAVAISTGSITPDPTATATKDESFVNLTCLKAACIIDRGAASSAARKAFAARDGGSSYDNRAAMQGKLALLEKGWCAVYEDAKLEYQTGQVRIAGAAVLGPFRLYAMDGLSNRQAGIIKY